MSVLQHTRKKPQHSLRQLIKSSFLRLTIAVSITFAFVSISLISFTEYNLFIPHMEHDFEHMIHVHSLHSGYVEDKYKDSVFYRVDDNNMQRLPEYLRNLDVGNHEILHNNQAFHLLVKEDVRYRYIFRINQSDFEKMELVIIGIIIVSMLLSWIVASFSSRYLSRKILDPIQLLSDKIRTLDHDKTAIRLSDDFSADEVGQLAHYFDDYNQKINAYLKREQLFTSDVSHELRTPLMIISSTTELLLAQRGETDSDFSHLLKIQSACKDMNVLVSVFLALARNDDINVKKLTADKVLQEQYEKFLPVAQKKGLVLTYEINENSDRTFSQEFLTIVVSNLLRNAIKYTVTGEIKMILKQDAFSILDTGPGIPSDIKNQVFEPFVGTHHNSSTGIGLGLSIVKRICEKKGWNIRLETEKDQGTAIHIALV